jgi:hypothetical protein
MDRMVIVTVDTLAEILKDYVGEENLPSNAWVTQLLVKPSEQGKFAINFESPDIKPDTPALNVNFGIKRVWGAS